MKVWKWRIVAALFSMVCMPVWAAGPAADTAGAIGNQANHGLAAINESYLFLIVPVSAGDDVGCRERVFRIDRNGDAAQRIRLADQEAWDLALDGDYLYYSNWSDGHRLYRMKTDGSEATALSGDAVSNIVRTGDVLLYIKWGNEGLKDHGIYKLSLDGQRREPVTADAADEFTVAGDWIYYSNASDSHKPYRVRPDGTGRREISGQPVLFMIADQDWVYYSSYVDGRLYKMKTDGTGIVKLADDKAGFINRSGDWVYYTNASDADNLYKVRTDGSGRQKVAESGGLPQPINIVGGQVYYRGQWL